MSPKDYRTPYEKASHKAYIQYKLDLVIADEAFSLKNPSGLGRLTASGRLLMI